MLNFLEGQTYHYNGYQELDNLKYSKNCLKRSLKNRQTKVIKINGSLIKVKSIAECSLGAFCNTFYLHLAIICLETNNLASFWGADYDMLYSNAFLIERKSQLKGC